MRKIVIVGGGFAGSSIARKLESKFLVTLIDSKEYFEFTPGILRTIIEPQHLSKIQVLHENYLNKTEIIKSIAKKITSRYVQVNGFNHKFDYLCLCLGSTYETPIKSHNLVLPARASQLAFFHEKLEEAKKILLIGGGVVGVELAAEICAKYDKKITLIHSQERLMERMDVKASSYAEKFLRKKGVEMIFNERVLGKKGKKYYTNKNTFVEADLTFLCTGIKPSSESLKSEFSQVLDSKNYIKVNKKLQVNGYKNIFAAGDIISLDIEKTAQEAKIQADLVARNIIALEKKKRLQEYVPKTRLLVISLGRWNGIFAWKNFVFSGFIPPVLKSLIEFKEIIKLKI